MPSSNYCPRCLTTFADTPEHCPNLVCGGPKPRAGWGTLLGVGDLLDRHYKIIKPLAVGGAGLTYLAQEVDGDGNPQPPDLAIKVLYTQRDSGPFLRRLSNEAQILQELSHDNIVECRGFVHRSGHAPYLVTLFERGGGLNKHVKTVGPLSAAVAGGTLRQILLALDVAHDRSVVHRDLKPENVLLRETVSADTVPRVRVADFGIAKVSGFGGNLTSVGTFVGTPEYAAPEQFEGKAPSPATDVFAAGGLFFFLLTGRAPVTFSHRLDIGQCYTELLTQVPPQAPINAEDPVRTAIVQDILDHMMTPDPTLRWTIRQVLARLDDLFAGRPSTKAPARSDSSGLPGHSPAEPLGDLRGETNTYVLGADANERPETPAAPSSHGTLNFTEQGHAPTDLSNDDAFATLVPGDVELAADDAPPAAPPERLAPAQVARPQVARQAGVPSEPSAPAPRPSRRLALRKSEQDANTGGSAGGGSDPMDDFFSAPKKKPNELSLDDLFGGGDVDDDEASVPEMFATPSRPSSGRVQQSDSSFFVDETARTQPTPPSPVDELPKAMRASGRWSPESPADLPAALPADARSLLRLLGEADPADRPTVHSALSSLDSGEVTAALRGHRANQDAAIGRGVALTIAALGDASLANVARGLVQDREPSVRACAAEALGAVASGGLLAQLSRLLGDGSPLVRASAARAVGEACARAGQQSMGRGWLARLERDTDNTVQEAYRIALGTLD